MLRAQVCGDARESAGEGNRLKGKAARNSEKERGFGATFRMLAGDSVPAKSPGIHQSWKPFFLSKRGLVSRWSESVELTGLGEGLGG